MALHDKDLQKLQAMMMIQMKVHGMGKNEIATALNIHPDTVDRRLAFAKKAGMFLDFERKIFEEIVPKAIEAVKTALDDGDAETALEILKCTGVIQDSKAPKTSQQQAEVDELQKAIADSRTEQLKLEETYEGTVVKRTSLAGLLTAGNAGDEPSSETAVDPNGDSTSAGASEDEKKTS